MAALAWIEDNVPPGGRVVIAGAKSGDSELRVFSGSDAGVWVTPLTERRTTLKPYNMKWTSPRTKAELCGLGSAYVYAGGWPFGFDPRVLGRLDWLTPAEQFPPVVIFRLNCSAGSG